MSKVLIFVALLIYVAGAQTTPFTQLLNALFSRSELDTVVQPKFASDGIGFTVGSCSGDFPPLADIQYVLGKGSIKFCYDQTIGFPFNNGTAGYEVDAIKNWSDLINAQYHLTVSVNFVNVLTESIGLFPSLFAALEAETCDGIMSSIFETANRSAVAQPSCAYGSSLSGFARGTLDSSLNISTVEQLNATGIKIGTIAGTVYQTYNAIFPMANFVFVTNFTDLYDLNSNGTVHAILYDAPILFTKAADAPETLCGASSCKVFAFAPGFDLVVYSNLTAPASASATDTASASASAKRAIYIPPIESSAITLVPMAFLLCFYNFFVALF